jgi:hypothetical protein
MNLLDQPEGRLDPNLRSRLADLINRRLQSTDPPQPTEDP